MKRRDLRRGRRSNRAALGRFLLVVIIGVGLVWFGLSLRPTSTPKKAATVKIEKASEKEVEEKSVVDQRTFLIIGVDEGAEKDLVTEVLVVVFDPAGNRINGMIIDPDTYVAIPARGYESISDGFDEGPEKIDAAISSMTGYKSEGYVVISGEQIETLKDEKKLDEALTQNTDSNISARETSALAEKLGNIPKERIQFLSLPIKTIVIGEQTYYEPNKKDLDKTILAIWGQAPKKKEAPLRIIILNGNGTPGIARKAADRLVGDGYKILDIKNADRFDYAKTEILLYSPFAKESGRKVAKALETGVLLKKNMAQDVTDIVIVVGEDFN